MPHGVRVRVSLTLTPQTLMAGLIWGWMLEICFSSCDQVWHFPPESQHDGTILWLQDQAAPKHTHHPGWCWPWWSPPDEGKNSCRRRRWETRFRRCSWRSQRSPWQWRWRWLGPEAAGGNADPPRRACSGWVQGRSACKERCRWGRGARLCRWAATTPASGSCHSG